MRLLLVEDEAPLREQLALQLQRNGYAVDSAADGREALYLIQEYNYDLAVIDLGLPIVDGLTVIRKARELQKRFPILVLTARGRWQDKVEGLEAGGDDYVVKPFQIEEVIARLNALLRRTSGFASPLLAFESLVIDTAKQEVTVVGTPVELTAFEYKALLYLTHRHGQVVSKTELTEHLYDQDFDRDSNVIEVFIGRLRKKLDPEHTLNPIATVRGRGYRFELKSLGDA
ncbi:MAG: response regulator with CheY-like receiver domain and winged-helix DNA-binding domain [Verrucomicrobiaceae bacterium]|nr:response regulator with CheY-like receiver domain and winged-helix DNA-binding domain [Verrucomicrobiaceae bacterium]